MTEVHARLHPVVPLQDLVREARLEVPRLVTRIVQQIQQDVPSYSGPALGDRHRLITMAVGAAIGHFLDRLEDPTADDPRLQDLFRQMGHGEAKDGHELDQMRAALRIASRVTWAWLSRFAVAHDLPTSVLTDLTDALFSYLDHLDTEVTRGHQWGRQGPTDPDRARADLMACLLTPGLPGTTRRSEISGHAEKAGWPLPGRVVAMRASFHGTLTPGALPVDVLMDTTASPATLICDAEAADEVALRISRSAPGVRVSVSWPVVPEQTDDAHRWATRALDLVGRGVIAPLHVVNCHEHAVQLWLHAEPLLRQQLTQDLLVPLLSETTNSREILSETMLAWLESRDSAPAIAAKLGVHPQTVRYRWKRINELFGELLHDPDFIVSVTMVLKATVPLWKAGDTGDVRCFQEGQAHA